MHPQELYQRLETLGELRRSGVLTEPEFNAEKARLLGSSATTEPPAPAVQASWGRNTSDAITNILGLDKIEAFSFKQLFSDVLRKHGPDEVENIFSVGTILTTPRLDPHMANFPNPWIFFRILIGMLIVYGVFLLSFGLFGNAKIIPGLIAIGSFAAPIAVLVFFFEMNTPRNVSASKLVLFLMVGGSASLFISLTLFAFAPLLTSMFGASAAGIVEECGKLAAVIATMSLIAKDRYPYRLNAMLFGAAVGTGFSAFESAGYAFEALISEDLRSGEGVVPMLATIFFRGLLAAFSHTIWTAIAAAAYWSARQENVDLMSTLRSKKFLVLFAAPVTLHFIWNLGLGLPYLLDYWILGAVGWVIVISLVQTGLREVGDAAASQGAPPR